MGDAAEPSFAIEKRTSGMCICIFLCILYVFFLSLERVSAFV